MRQAIQVLYRHGKGERQAAIESVANPSTSDVRSCRIMPLARWAVRGALDVGLDRVKACQNLASYRISTPTAPSCLHTTCLTIELLALGMTQEAQAASCSRLD
jgi:hypothetical protein